MIGDDEVHSDDGNQCENPMGHGQAFVKQRPKLINFERRKELMRMAGETADDIVRLNVLPHELRLFLSTISTLLDKNEY
jgi:hypothetical protein